MGKRIVVLGAGFGGLELCTTLSEAAGDEIDVTLIDKSDAFVFGFSKLDVMFGRAAPQAVRLAYSDVVKPGVRVLQEVVTAIDPETRRVTTDAGVHEADVLIVALGAEYDMDATPGLADGANEFYSVAGAERLAGIIPTFSQGHVVIGVCGAPFKCPPAPSECALLLHDEMTARGVRDACQISFVMPLGRPVPPLRRRLRTPSKRSSLSAASLSSVDAASTKSTRSARSQSSTTAASCHSTCSWECLSIVPPPSRSRAV
jgi:sulfide:quinone oxidoreductase